MLDSSENIYEGLLYMLVHEITNPVTINQIVINKLRRGNLGRDLNKDLETLQRANTTLIDLISQVRILLAVKSGKLPTQVKSENISAIIGDVIQLQQVLADTKNIRLNFNPPQEAFIAKIEPSLIKSIVLSNLINNAIKFSPENSDIDIRLDRDGDSFFKIEIQDYGVGIPKELRPFLFCADRPTNRPGTKGEKGTGFGLPIVKNFLDLMNGSIEVISNSENKSDSGSTFVIKLPLNPQ